MKFRPLMICALLALPLPALAQQAAQQSVDPRLAGPTVAALQAMVALRDAQIKAISEDAHKRIAELEKQAKDAAKPAEADKPSPALPE